jgi:hypothetical protein
LGGHPRLGRRHAVVITAFFFVVMAVHNGWIGVTARTSSRSLPVLVMLGGWLYERHGRTQAASDRRCRPRRAPASDAATTLPHHPGHPPSGCDRQAVGALALFAAALGLTGDRRHRNRRLLWRRCSSC